MIKKYKEILRKSIVRRIKEIPGNEKKRLDERIFEKTIVLPEVENARIVATYVSKEREVDTHKLIKYFLENCKEILVPFVKGKELLFSQIYDFDKDLELGCFGILEPKNKKPTDVYKADTILVPGIAFDEQGYRIGYGGGYFDKVLKNFKNAKIGLAYKIQIISEVPREEHDVPVDVIVTEKRVVRCKKSIRRVNSGDSPRIRRFQRFSHRRLIQK